MSGYNDVDNNYNDMDDVNVRLRKRRFKAFCDYIDSGDIWHVRESLLAEITLNGAMKGSYKSFNDMERYASERIKSLYDKHSDSITDEYGFKPIGGELISDKSKWDEDYVYEVRGYALNYNFSRERIKHLKKVVRYVYMADIITTAIYRDIISKYDIKINFSDSLSKFRLNKDNKEEFKKLVMEEIKKQLEIKNEFVYNDIINGSYFNEIDYV